MVRERAVRTNRERGEDTRRQVVAATGELIARQGARRLSLSEIAAHAGVSKTNLLHHFGSKDGLLHAVLDVHDERDGYPQLFPDRDIFGLLDDLVDAVRRWADDVVEQRVWLVLLSENMLPEDPLYERVAERLRVTHLRLEQAIAEAQAAGAIDSTLDPDIEAANLLAFIHGLASYQVVEPGRSMLLMAERWRSGCLQVWCSSAPVAAPT